MPLTNYILSYTWSTHSQMLRISFVQRCRAIKKAIKKVIRKQTCNDLFIAFLAPLVAKAGDGNRRFFNEQKSSKINNFQIPIIVGTT